jgi:hypothetical protein
MSKRKTDTTEISTRALLVRCFNVGHYEDSDTLVACAAGPARIITPEERTQLLAFTSSQQASGLSYVLAEPMEGDRIQELVRKAVQKAEDNRAAAERHRVAEENRRKQADLRRKQKRLAQLEAKAKQV